MIRTFLDGKMRVLFAVNILGTCTEEELMTFLEQNEHRSTEDLRQEALAQPWMQNDLVPHSTGGSHDR